MKRIKSTFLFSLIIFSTLIGSGCEKSNDYEFVDLSEKSEPEKQTASISDPKQLRVAIAAMISPKETLVYYEEILNYIGSEVGYEVTLIQRKTYSEVNKLFPKRLIDLAFVCSGPYANEQAKYKFEGLATPIVRGKPYYQSYMIVQKNSSYNSLEDLRGRIFAFTDPDSNTGSLVPRFWLYQRNEDPESFFNRIIYTYSHDNSILAVAKGLVDGAAVDGHKWEFYNAKNPAFTSKTRVIKKSDHFGSPPLVASSFLPPQLKANIQNVILTMHKSDIGEKILENLIIDRFERPKDEWYENVKSMCAKVRKKL